MESPDLYKQKLCEEFSARLQLLERTYGKKIRQKCGQRIFGPRREEKYPMPPKGSEIYVAKLPSTTYEDVLIPFFSQAGVIYKMRLMLEFSGLSRNFCFITFNTPEMANRAISMFHGYKFMGKRMRVFKSLDNCTLHLTGIPWHVERNEILKVLGARFKGALAVDIKHIHNSHKMYAFVTFDSHQHAANARKVMWPATDIWDSRIHVEWARPRNEKTIKVQNTIIVKNLSRAMKRDELMEYLLHYFGGSFTKVDRAIGTDMAVIEFASEIYAERAVHTIDGHYWKGHVLYAAQATYKQCKNMAQNSRDFMNYYSCKKSNNGNNQFSENSPCIPENWSKPLRSPSAPIVPSDPNNSYGASSSQTYQASVPENSYKSLSGETHQLSVPDDWYGSSSNQTYQAGVPENSHRSLSSETHQISIPHDWNRSSSNQTYQASVPENSHRSLRGETHEISIPHDWYRSLSSETHQISIPHDWNRSSSNQTYQASAEDDCARFQLSIQPFEPNLLDELYRELMTQPQAERLPEWWNDIDC